MVIEKGKQIAGARAGSRGGRHRVRSDGRFTIAGTDRSIGIMELAERCAAASSCPRACRQRSTSASSHEAAPSAFPNGCHVCEVEIDPETGLTRGGEIHVGQRLRRRRQPAAGRGPGHGGVAQGIGQALLERRSTTRTASSCPARFMDYALPRADDVPSFAHRPPPGAGHDQPARRQGLRRGGLRRLAAGGDERAGRCAVVRQAYRHAGDARARLEGAAFLRLKPSSTIGRRGARMAFTQA